MANSLAGLLNALRGRVAVQDDPAGEGPASLCGCPLPEGCWGSGGWHYYRATVYTMDRWQRIRFAEERPGWAVVELQKTYGDWWQALDVAGQLNGEGVPLIWLPYLGQAVAYQPCAAYRAAVARNLEAETAKKNPARRGYDRPANARWTKTERGE